MFSGQETKGKELMDDELAFDTWAELAASDVDAFESKRRAVVDAFISSQPDQFQKQLRQLQWKVDAVRCASPNPLASCIRIYDLMLEMAYGESGLIERMKTLVGPQGTSPENPQEKRTALVLPLTPTNGISTSTK